MQTDTIKALFSYGTALVIIIGGGLFLFATRLDPPESASQDYGLLVAGFIGAAVTWIFSSESATRSARSTSNAIEQGGVLGAQMPQSAPLGLMGPLDLDGLPDAVEDEYDPDDDLPENEDAKLASSVPVGDRPLRPVEETSNT